MTPKDKENLGILVKSIIEKDHGMIRVKDSALIPYYAHNSKYMIEVEPEDKSELRFLKSQRPTIEEDFKDLKSEHLRLAKELSTNYIFASTYYENHGVLVSVANPFKIISENETDFLLKNYYKDVPEEVSKAASSLGINLFDKQYAYYLQGMTNEPNYRCREDYQQFVYFLNFVFSLPYEEQSIKINKKLIRQGFSDFDAVGILVKEYSQGKHFQEYFDALDYESYKNKVVEQIKCLERKPDNDIFLLKHGFVVGEDSVLQLYRQDARAFINYFQKLSDESQKIVIEKVYDDSFINQEVVDWLEKNYTDVLREVGFSGGKQNGSNR